MSIPNLSVLEFSKRVNRSPAAIRGHIKRGNLKVKLRNVVVIPESEIEDFIKEYPIYEKQRTGKKANKE